MIVLYIPAYLLIGGFMLAVASQFEPDIDEAGVCLILVFWPLMLFMLVLLGIVALVYKAGEALGKKLKKLMR